MQQSSTHPYQFNWFDWFCLWYPPGWLILFNRHWQHYHADPDGWNWVEYLLFLIPGGFYLALLLRWLRLGYRLPHQQDYQFCPEYQQAFRDEILAPIIQSYFRAELHQIENLPDHEPLIVAMNHAGMSFPWDFLGLAYLLGKTKRWTVQPLAGVSLFEHPWMVWWLPRGWSKALGGVRAEVDEFEAVVAKKTVLLYAPEGLRGPCKGWPQRYQLQTFHPSFIRLSDRYQIPILPVVCLGNEFLHPLAFNSRKLAKLLSMPFFPFSLGMFAFIFFPSMGVWAMKTKLRYYIQPLHQPGQEEKADSSKVRSLAYQKAQQLQEKLQHQINQLLLTS
ncbi:MAG: 1-acyl-sn-glycerol-3-phosphate acyltransferase [Coleofasciculaceae cyanobacterium]